MTSSPRPRLVLAAVVTAQLMVGIDATILALATPGMTADLHLSSASLAWVMAGYVLAAGSLMIASGRIAQAVGYTRMMTVGLIVFGLASLVGGAATAGWELIAARIAQGIGAAMMTPAAMARLSAAFPGEGREKAYGVYGMIMGSGTAIGLLLGGVLMQSASWRACLYVNIVFVTVSLVLSALAGDRVERSPGHGRGAWRGGLLALGAAAIIQALLVVERPVQAAGFCIAGLVLTGAFIVTDRRSATSLIPIELFRNPSRRVAYLGLFLWGVATITTFVTASRSLQHEYLLSPLLVGALFLVYPLAIQIGLFVSRRLGWHEPAPAIAVGLALIGAGQIAFAFSPAGLSAVPVALTLMGLGTSQVMPNANSAMNRDAGRHAGVAGAVGTTSQQLGGSVGMAIPVALAVVTTHVTTLVSGLIALALLSGAVLAFRTSRTRMAPQGPDLEKQHSA